MQRRCDRVRCTNAQRTGVQDEPHRVFHLQPGARRPKHQHVSVSAKPVVPWGHVARFEAN